jgi:ribonuclease HII
VTLAISSPKSCLADQASEKGIAGVDEAGRGPWAGPVLAAAVILDPARPIDGLQDSKKLSASKRESLCVLIQARSLAWSVAQASVEEIDTLNILQATLLAMRRAVEGLSVTPCEVWIDGNRAPELNVPCRTVVGGDASVAAIAAASILAKVHRDAWCTQMDARYPQYGFARHKGYGTAAHHQVLLQYGPCAQHRRSFAPVARLLESSGEMDG